MAGLFLDDWQQFVLRHALGEKPDGKWAASRVGLVVGRQNGKNSILEARELAGLFLFGERLIIHTAHEQATASEQHARLVDRLRSSPKLWARVDRPIYGKGSEAIVMKSGQRILFRTRTGGAGKGFTVDCLIFDESFHLNDTATSALLPAMAARSKLGNLQRWYTSSAVDQQNSKHDGLVLARIRERGLAGDDDLAYFEWSVEGDDPDRVSEDVAADPRVWALANPGLNIRITPEWVEGERTGGEMSPRGFAVERLGIGDWPSTDANGGRVITDAMWAACADPASRVTGPPMFAIDLDPSQAWATVAAAGKRDDGLWHVGVVEHGRGTGWIVEAVAGLLERFPGSLLVVDPRNEISALLTDFDEAAIRPVRMTAHDYAAACGGFFEAVAERRLRYMPPQPELDSAVAGARTMPLLDAWKWSRKGSGALITPLVACTLALWAARTQAAPQVHSIRDAVARLRATDINAVDEPLVV